eukprot:scaffold27440_cov124-Isochrysis_galbana.AAC.3
MRATVTTCDMRTARPPPACPQASRLACLRLRGCSRHPAREQLRAGGRPAGHRPIGRPALSQRAPLHAARFRARSPEAAARISERPKKKGREGEALGREHMWLRARASAQTQVKRVSDFKHDNLELRTASGCEPQPSHSPQHQALTCSLTHSRVSHVTGKQGRSGRLAFSG